MTYFNEFGQARLGWNVGTPSGGITPSTLWNSIYSIYNADSVGSSSLKTSLYAAYNGESNANDSFGTLNGTAQGGLTYTAGKIGNAFTGNGTNAYVRLPRTTNEFDFTGDFSISVWFNQSTSANIFNNYYSTGTTNRYGYNLYLQGGRLRFATYKGNTGALSASNIGQATATVINTNTWYHVVITKTTSNAFKMYINGVLQTLTVIDGDLSLNPVYSSSNTVNIGAEQGLSQFLNGKIDSLNTWTRELTQSEITELYNSGNGSQYITDNFYKPTTNDALNTYNGTAQGGLTYGVGKVGTAFQFNGTNAYVQLGDVMDVGTSSWSYSMWFNASQLTAGNYYALFAKHTATSFAGRVWAVIYGNQIQLNIQVDNSNTITVQTTSTFNTNTWYHVVCVLDRNDNLKIYVNGVLQTITTVSGTNNLIPYLSTNYNNNSPFRIGAGAAADNTTGIALFNGQIDTFNSWNRVLTASEITELYNAGTGKQYPN